MSSVDIMLDAASALVLTDVTVVIAGNIASVVIERDRDD